MSEQYYERYDQSEGELICQQCKVPLENGEVILQYMGNDFPIEMPRCPICGQDFIPEDLATGKILQVEKALEDK